MEVSIEQVHKESQGFYKPCFELMQSSYGQGKHASHRVTVVKKTCWSSHPVASGRLLVGTERMELLEIHEVVSEKMGSPLRSCYESHCHWEEVVGKQASLNLDGAVKEQYDC